MKKCWANVLGGCSGKISREHPVSKAIFAEDTLVSVMGMQGIHGGAFTDDLALSKLAAKILCTPHNSALAELDDVAVSLAIAVKQAKREDGFEGELRISGHRLERWALKALCGIMAAGWNALGRRLPDESVVRVIFGELELPDPLGLHIPLGLTNGTMKVPAVNSAMVAPIGNEKNILADIHSLRSSLCT